MSQLSSLWSQVSWIALWGCSLNVMVIVIINFGQVMSRHHSLWLSLSLSLSLSFYFSLSLFCSCSWSCQVSKVTSLKSHKWWVVSQWQGHLLSCLGTAKNYQQTTTTNKENNWQNPPQPSQGKLETLWNNPTPSVWKSQKTHKINTHTVNFKSS